MVFLTLSVSNLEMMMSKEEKREEEEQASERVLVWILARIGVMRPELLEMSVSRAIIGAGQGVICTVSRATYEIRERRRRELRRKD
jgi:hypothetical protein